MRKRAGVLLRKRKPVKSAGTQRVSKLMSGSLAREVLTDKRVLETASRQYGVPQRIVLGIARQKLKARGWLPLKKPKPLTWKGS